MNWDLIVLTFENTEELFNFNQAFFEGKVEEGYAPLDKI